LAPAGDQACRIHLRKAPYRTAKQACWNSRRLHNFAPGERSLASDLLEPVPHVIRYLVEVTEFASAS
jgi:hypothetical protein